MIVVLQRGSSEAQVAEVVAELERRGLSVRILRGGEKPLIHLVDGPTRAARGILKMERVQALVPTSGPRVRREGRRFYPYHFIGWGAACLMALAALVVLAGYFPPGLGEDIDMRRPPAESTWPWYLRLPAQVLSALPGWLAALSVALVVALLFLLPVLDPGERRGRGRSGRAALGIALTMLFASGAAALPQEPQPVRSGSCAVCHGAEARSLAASVHDRAGIGCTTCHGGVEGTLEKEAAHGGGLATLARPAAAVQACGGCHADLERMRLFGLRTDQLPLFRTSQHGQRLELDPEAEVATCVSCHGSHGVLRASDPRSPVHPFNQVRTCGVCHSDPELMAPYGLDPAVPEAWRGSVHGRALIDEGHVASPACTDCHGSHGATPPRVDEVGRVCGHCHSRVQEYFEESPHMPAVLSGEIEECISCHGSHAIVPPTARMLSAAGGGLCAMCHQGDSEALATAESLRQGLQSLDDGIESTELMLHQAAQRGLFIDEESGYLDDARGLRVRAAAVTHTLSPVALSDLLNRGLAMVEETRERLDIKARAFRDRKIFTTLFFAVAVVCALVLLTYRREIRGAWDGARRRPRRRED